MKNLHTALLAAIALALPACNETPAWQLNCERVLEDEMNVHFTIECATQRAKVGDSVELTVALVNPTDVDVDYEIMDDGDVDGFRAYAIDAVGKRQEIGYMLNLNRGPTKRFIHLPAGERIEKTFECLLGRHYVKGEVTETLPAGEYQLGVQLGERMFDQDVAAEAAIGVLQHAALTIE